MGEIEKDRKSFGAKSVPGSLTRYQERKKGGGTAFRWRTARFRSRRKIKKECPAG